MRKKIKENDVKIFGYILGGLAALVALIALAFVLELGGLKWAAFFAPKHEAVRREVFKTTRSYNESKTQDLAKFRLEYLRAEGTEKDALASTIRIMFADYDHDLLPNELAVFLTEIRGY